MSGRPGLTAKGLRPITKACIKNIAENLHSGDFQLNKGSAGK